MDSLSNPNPDLLQFLEVEELQVGDLIFCDRPSPLQWLCDSVHDHWRHVGMIVDVDGKQVMVEAGMLGYRVRDVDEVFGAYRRIGIARVGGIGREEMAEIAGQLAAFDDKDYTFPLPAIVAAGCGTLLRQVDASRSSKLRQPLNRYANRLSRATDTFLCSHFVVQPFLDFGVDVGLPPKTPLQLLTPGDVWRLPIIHNRWQLKNLRATNPQ